MRHGSGWGLVLPVVLVLGSGCATRDWVNDVIAQKNAELAQRVGRVEGQVAQRGAQIDGRISDVDGRVGTVEGRVGAVETRVTGVEGRVGQEGQRIDGLGGQLKVVEASMGQVDQRARGAQARADTAMTRAGGVDTRLGRLWSNRYGNRVAESLDVYFSMGQSDLGDGAQTELLRVVRELEAHPTLTVELHGFTDPSGVRELNYQLSQRRIEAVRRFLARQGVSLGRIQSVVQGPIADPKVPADRKRRVTVKLMVDKD